MRKAVFAALLCLPLAAPAQTKEERKVIDTWLLSGTTGAAAKEAAVVRLLDQKPALARSTELLVAGLDQAGVAGEMGARGKKLAEMLLARGADPNATDKDGMPLLVHYGMFARTAPMEILLANGAKPDAGDSDRRGALHWLCTLAEHEREPVVVDRTLEAAALLLDRKADPNAKDKRGATPLHLAAHNGARRMVELLLARGADMNAVDDAGYSPLGGASLRVEEKPGKPSFANEKEKAATREVIELLKKKGAKDIQPR